MVLTFVKVDAKSRRPYRRPRSLHERKRSDINPVESQTQNEQNKAAPEEPNKKTEPPKIQKKKKRRRNWS